MSYVFISYVHDNEKTVQRLCETLTSHGIVVWLDRNDIKPGTRWKKAIRKAISEGAFFIACFSKEYSKRVKTYMNEELRLAIAELRKYSDDRVWFIPVMLSKCEIPDIGISGHETLRDLQYVELYSDWDDGVKRIIDVIQPIMYGKALVTQITNLRFPEHILLQYTSPRYSNRIRRSAIVALRKLGSKGVQSVCMSILRPAIDNPRFQPKDQNLWETAIKTLGEVGDAKALEVLLKLWYSGVERSTFEKQALKKAIALLEARLGATISPGRSPLTTKLLEGMFSSLGEHYGTQNWWKRHNKFQVCLEAILSQGIGWRNVGLAIDELEKKGFLTPVAIHEMPEEDLQRLIQPYGMARAKATYIRNFVGFLEEEYNLNIQRMLREDTSFLREELLGVIGIGPFTCDNILLYAADKQKLPINKRLRKVFLEHDLIDEADKYESIQTCIERVMPFEPSAIKEFDAMIYRVAKDYCHSIPECGKCPLKQFLPESGPRSHRHVCIVGRDGAKMVLVPAGEFSMGSNDGLDREKPVHEVYLDAFYIDAYPVTNAQYSKFMEATRYPAPKYWSDPKFSAPEQPVVGLKWQDVLMYCGWAEKRVPTEAEWEKAARGGLAGKQYPWGDEEPDENLGNFGKNVGQATPVGKYPPNGYGLHDMAGNVWEWCADWYDENYYEQSPRRNPKGPSSGKARVLRGGSWYSKPSRARVAHRTPYISFRLNRVGLRCVRGLQS